MQIKVDFTQGQRMEIVNGFLYEFKQSRAYGAIGTYLKSIICEAIKLRFLPTSNNWPPLETENIRKEKDGKILSDDYIFEIELNLNPIVGDYKLKLKKSFPKSSLANK